MAKQKVGRNDPCPCGSGKKYKKCCGIVDDLIEASDPFTRGNQLMTAVKVKLDEYFENAIKKIRKDAQTQFLRFSVNRTLPLEHESIFSDWLWFDLLTEDENTLAYHYLVENGYYIARSLSDTLGALSISFPSVYQVEEISDYYIRARDVFLDRPCDILLKEPWEGIDGDTDLLLFGRLVKIEDEGLFSGMVLAVDNKAGQKGFLLEHMEFIRHLLNETMINTLKFHGEMLYGVFDHTYNKTLVNFNDIRCCDIDEENRVRLLDNLTAGDEYERLYDSAGFTWFTPAGENRGYVRIMIGETELVTCADVLDDIRQLEETVTTLLPGKELQVISNRFLQAPPPADKNQLWFTIVKDQETERWLDTPMSELEGKSPRERLSEDGGREQLMAMLDRFLTTRENETEKELIEYFKERIS
ncbi:MAG: DUF2384 domain-containing protein [Syntrophomonadaceae bacterium]|nr:DUF2384 domain-containing protein [Syntrophomonadaceae bacterium]